MDTNTLNEILLIVLKALGAILTVLFYRYGLPWLKASGYAQQLAVVARLAKEAYVWVEVQAPELKLKGEHKLQMAIDYLDARLVERGITVSVDQMRAVIEDVWLEYNPTKLQEH